MKAILLAGGEGKRLRPITFTRPKPFVPVGNRPCIEYVLDRLREAGVKDAVITTCYKPETLLQHLGGGERHGLNIAYSIEDEPRGTAGAVKKLERFLTEPFIVASGDVFADVDIARLVAFHKASGGLVTMALTRVENPSEFGVVEVDAAGRVTGFQEKPDAGTERSNLVNAGIYVIDPAILQVIPPHAPFDFSRDLFPLLLEKSEPIHGQEIEGNWVDIGRPADLLRANNLICDRDGRALVAEGAEVAPSAYLDHASVAAGVRVAARVRVQRSIVLENAEIQSECVIKDSIIGAGVQVGAGARIENAVIGDDVIIEAKAEVMGDTIAPGDVVQRLSRT